MPPQRTTRSKAAPPATKIIPKAKGRVIKPKRNPVKKATKLASIEASPNLLSAKASVAINRDDPLAVLDDLSFDLILQFLDVEDILSACAVSRLWRSRMDSWILTRTSRLRKMAIGVPFGLDPGMKPGEYVTAWRRKASIHIRKKNGQPTKAMKLVGVIDNLCETIAGTVAWIRHEKPAFKYQWGIELAYRFSESHPFEKYQGFVNTTLCVQQPITPTDLTLKPGEIRVVRLQTLIPRKFSKGVYLFRPISLKLWKDPNSSKLLAIIQAHIMNPEQNDNYDHLHKTTIQGAEAVYLTLAVDLAGLKTLWCFDNLDSTFGGPRGPIDTTISTSGTYTMLCRGPNTNQSSVSLVNYDILTGEQKDVYTHLPDCDRPPIYWPRKYFYTPQRIVSHPTQSIFFLPLDFKDTILIVTKTRTYRFPSFPKFCKINPDAEDTSPVPIIYDGPDEYSPRFRVSFDASQASTLSYSYEPEHPVGLNRRLKNVVQMVFTYDISPELETTQAPDIDHLIRLRRARQFTIPIATLNNHLPSTVDELLADSFDLETHQMIGYSWEIGHTLPIPSSGEMRTAIYNFTKQQTPDYAVVVVEGNGLSGGSETSRKLVVEHFGSCGGTVVTTRPKKDVKRGKTGKKKNVHEGKVDASEERKMLPMLWESWNRYTNSENVWMKITSETAMVLAGEKDAVIWMGFETGVGVKA